MKQKISLNGVIDMHVHAAPDICQRTYNDLELTAASIRAGGKGNCHQRSSLLHRGACSAVQRL